MEDATTSINSDNKYKRKRKRNFMYHARDYMKKGRYGRGTNIEGDTCNYLLKIMEVYKQGFSSEDEKIIFVRNAMQQTENNEINLCCNQIGCRVIETLLPSADAEVLRRFMTTLGGELRPLCCDPFSSHVLSALFAITCTKSLTLTDDDTFKIECKEFTSKLSKFLLNNLEDYVQDTYATHVIRSVIRNLAQIPKLDEKSRTVAKVCTVPEEVPDDYKEIVFDFGERLLVWPQFATFPDSEYTSGLLQILIQALAKLENIKLHKKYLLKLLKDNFSNESDANAMRVVPKVFLSIPAEILLNQCVESIGENEKIFLKYYESLFRGRLSELATSKANNRAVQSLLTGCRANAMYELIFDELADSFKQIMDAKNLNVLTILGSTCKRLTCRQGQYVQIIMKMLNCFEEERQNSLLLCLSRFVAYEDLPNDNASIDKEKLNMQGTIIVQTILEFNKPIKLIKSILSLDLNVLKGLFMNTNGCHIMDAYMRSTYVGERSREKLIRKLQGGYQAFVTSRFGSRAFDAIWVAASIKNKEFILQELSHQSGNWSHNEYGKHIARKMNINLYLTNLDSWRNSIGKTRQSKQILLT